MKKALTIFFALALVLFFFGIASDQAVAQGKGKKKGDGNGNGLIKTTWEIPGDFATIQEALDSSEVAEGHTIMVGPGIHAGATVLKAVEIKGVGNAIINDGPI